MGDIVILAVGLCALIYVSLRKRAFNIMAKLSRELPTEPKPSPWAEALKELIALSGGIYLSLLMITSFLQLNIPDKVRILGAEFEPIAALSILLALMQPFLTSSFNHNDGHGF